MMWYSLPQCNIGNPLPCCGTYYHCLALVIRYRVLVLVWWYHGCLSFLLWYSCGGIMGTPLPCCGTLVVVVVSGIQQPVFGAPQVRANQQTARVRSPHQEQVWLGGQHQGNNQRRRSPRRGPCPSRVGHATPRGLP